MTTPTTDARYTDWYAQNGTERNERRRARYAKDPAARKANAARAKEWREARAAGSPVTREVFRDVNGKRVRVYSLGQIADEAGYAISTLRLLVTQGVLPEPEVGGVHRYYTLKEVNKIKTVLKKRR